MLLLLLSITVQTASTAETTEKPQLALCSQNFSQVTCAINS